jgi:DNA repair photolyase
MIINTGMRTDIPAFYSEWLMNRVHEGFVYVRNPYYRLQVSKYSLSPDVVDCLAFCTKNPHPMLKYLDELKEKYNMFWFVTITPYGKELEPNVPAFEKVLEDFKTLSNKLGKNAVALRYDPILINEEYSVEKHIEMFDMFAKSLKGYTEDVTISFLDLYEKVKRNAPDIRPPNNEEQRQLAKEFVRIGNENNMIIHGCCENPNLKEVGIDITGCMSQDIVEKAIGYHLKAPSGQSKRIITDEDKGKPICNCLMGNDIGAYNSCMHLCKYCYANFDKTLVQANYKLHNTNSPFLIGESTPEDKITEAKQKSWIIIDDQISFID